MKVAWKLCDLLIWAVLLYVLDLSTIVSILVFLGLMNILYYCVSKLRSNRLNRFYEYTVKEDKVFIHFSPIVLTGFWINSKQLLAYRRNALEELQKKGFNDVYGDTISLTSINHKLPVYEKLDKWSKEGILTIITTLFASYGNIQNILKLSLTRKTVNLIFKYPYLRFKYVL